MNDIVACLRTISGNCVTYGVCTLKQRPSSVRWKMGRTETAEHLDRRIEQDIKPLLDAIDGYLGPMEFSGPACWRPIHTDGVNVIVEIIVPACMVGGANAPMTITPAALAETGEER